MQVSPLRQTIEPFSSGRDENWGVTIEPFGSGRDENLGVTMMPFVSGRDEKFWDDDEAVYLRSR